MSTISTHVLDQLRGRPAVGVRVELARRGDAGWERVTERATDDDGRVGDLVPAAAPAGSGIYRLRFDTGRYFGATDQPTLYPYVDVVFELSGDPSHTHVPLLAGPFGYTTYRGS